MGSFWLTSMRCVLRSALCISLLTFISSLMPHCSADDYDDTDDVVWRSKRVCGLNCIYFLLRAYGLTPDYLTLQRRMVKAELTSLYDIQRESAAHGLPLRLASFTPQDLSDVRKPIIAHFDVVDIEGDVGGHFVVVTRTTPSSVEFVDGTTVMTHVLDWRQFQRKWSGFVAHREADGSPWFLDVLAFVCGIVAGFTYDSYRRRKAIL